MKRPLVWGGVLLFVLFLLVGRFFQKEWTAKQECLQDFTENSARAWVRGTLNNIETKQNSTFFYLKKVSVSIQNRESKTYSLERLLVIAEKSSNSVYYPGNLLEITGNIQELETPGNPGQFNEKAYYREKNIYYKVFAENITCINPEKDWIKGWLYQLRQRFSDVFQHCLSSKDAGVISAMLLGEKAGLSEDIREQYQKNGIGHLLAISGLHISILCMLLFQVLSRMPLPRFGAFTISMLFLIAYGIMTGFGISVNRAIIMMIIMLFAKEMGRSYDALTAMVVSAVIILLQKPYAVFSCGFLLSYSAVLGAVYFYPMIKGICYGSLQEQKMHSKRNRRMQREKQKNSRFPFFIQFLFRFQRKLTDSLLCSTAISLVTLPVILFFFYEIPTYSILINLFVLPLISSVVLLALIGGVMGLFSFALAKFFLFPVHLVLAFYDRLCNFFEGLPRSQVIVGSVAVWKIFLYYLILLLLVWFLKQQIIYEKKMPPRHRILPFLCLLASCLFLCRKVPVNELRVMMMDVGQGDGILIQNPDGITVLIDGGSSDVKQVGKFRLVPFLKYYGVDKIDYMIMTHADSDHISGQMELLEKSDSFGITIKNCLLPKPEESCRDENYSLLVEAANKAKVPIRILSTGNRIHSGNLDLLCLHPDNGFQAESANAYSVTLSLTYKKSSMLLTGDLEGNGEETLLERMKQTNKQIATVL